MADQQRADQGISGAGSARSAGTGFAEGAAVILLLAAVASLIFRGGIISALAFALAALMAWERPFQENARKGRGAPSTSLRILMGGVLVVAGLAMLPTGAQPPTAAEQASQAATGPSGAETAAPVAGSSASPTVTIAEQQEMERRNEAKLKTLLADVKTLPKRDYEGQLVFWDQITALAPANARYVRSRQEVADHVAGVAHLIEHPEQGMIVEKVRGRKEGFGNVLVIDITLRNDSLSNLRDFRVTCESKGRSGTVMASNTRTLYEVVEARATRTFRKVNMGLLDSQATRTTCVVDEAGIA